MIYSLERRFLVLLLLPVALIVIGIGGVGWMYARSFLLDQWAELTRLKLQKAAHQIHMRLDERLELIRLIAKAEGGPDHEVLQTFLIQQLVAKEGVRFVDLDVLNNKNAKDASDPYGLGDIEGRYTLELCGDYGFCAPVMDPNSSDRSLKIVRLMGDNGGPRKRLVVRIDFDSFLAPIKQMDLWEGSTACLVTSTGQFLAHTDKSKSDRKVLGDTGDDLEKRVLDEMRHKPFGTVFGVGHPPDRVAGFYKLPFINWYLVLFSQGNVILAPIVEFRFYYGVAALISLILILMMIRIVTRSVGRSIAEISAAAAQVQNGDYAVNLPEETCDEIGQLSASFDKMIQGLKQRDLIEQTFGRYVDKKIAAELMSRPEALRMGGEKKTVTVMMSDLRNFTNISEKLQPEEVIKMLNRYFARMISIIERHKGIIVDFYGDSVLVFFDGLEADVGARAFDAVHCALEMQRDMDGYVKENIAAGLPEVTMGIGIHTGEVIVGNIGTESRAKYGIVGSDVNLTDRIQATASAGKVVISERTYEIICQKLNVSMEFKACLKGVEDQKKLYEIDSFELDYDACQVQ
ncbi:MAG TPA: adenylate/guanylate cyclase domain-containing protein [Desulfomonilaceae bacterium]|nr:adenylate/guanylate cyclase domain-containing protein [Desulfomonilaceae bacterium]